LIIDCLADETRRNILKILVEKKRAGASASELADFLKLRIPTIMEHLDLLEEAGLVRFQYRQRNGRMLKVYELLDTVITLQMDLELLSFTPNRTRLEEYAMEYFTVKRKEGLRQRFSIDDVQATLKLDERTAIVVYDFVATKRGEFDRMIGMDILETLKKKQEDSIPSLAGKMGINIDWIRSAVQYLSDKGYVLLSGKEIIKLNQVPS